MDQRFEANAYASVNAFRVRHRFFPGPLPPFGFDRCRNRDGYIGFRFGVRLFLASALLVSVADDGRCANSRGVVVVGIASLDSRTNGAAVPRTIALDVSLAQAGETILA